MFEGLIEMIEEYGRYKGVLLINEKGTENYLSVSSIKEIIREYVTKVYDDGR